MKVETKFGYCSYIFDYNIEDELYAEVHKLYIYPEFREKGKGRELLQSVITEIRDTGYLDEIMIEASPKEECMGIEKLTSFYKSMGFKVY